jgi:predicted GNAT superfamily acetyltransferase/catechol 2,3-dioxygenase-like lactoylglutathione lyase family enzyme
VIDHIGVLVSDFAVSKAFYVSALAPIGHVLLRESRAADAGGGEEPGESDTAGFGVPPTPDFWIGRGTPNDPPVHVAFRVSSRALVDAFYGAALAAGGRDNGAPGLRPRYHPEYYAAFVLDPDGHNIEAVCRDPEARARPGGDAAGSQHPGDAAGSQHPGDAPSAPAPVHSRPGSHMLIRPAEERDFPAVLALNEESVRVLAPLPPERLELLHRKASLHWVAEEGGRVVGFVLAFREGIDHDSVNYKWFAERYPTYLYVDRVVVGADARGLGAGTRLYEELFAHALATGAERVTAEFDVDPPNPASAHFHAKFGFHEAGRQVVPYGMKEVSMQVAETAATRP